ncbi:MAG: adenine phosphoribosyltransferase [Litorivicinaceae bacterium]|nr:adenine phosphoribosyltransferase [Gammaproteobacteria bacterium]RZO81786.1 MAG: adenine phosphoribosyltransferase [Litorivicinaceae bacterium]|tara:strand:- start:3188 stop:3709 length:522 start_codon:yes stop_codon:yes gene_type:complete
MSNPIDDLIRTYPDFPKPGILFYDIASLIENSEGLKLVTEQLSEIVKKQQPDVLVAIDSRGFIFAPPVALKYDIGVVLVRKSGKLPGETIDQSYGLEYGTDVLCLQKDRQLKGLKALIIDDLLATGGTIAATEILLEKAGATVLGSTVIIELKGLNGRSNIKYPAFSLTQLVG